MSKQLSCMTLAPTLWLGAHAGDQKVKASIFVDRLFNSNRLRHLKYKCKEIFTSFSRAQYL